MLSNLSWCCACTLEIPQSGPRIKALLRKNVELRAPLEHLKGKLIERVIEESRRLRRNANGESADDADGKHAHELVGTIPAVKLRMELGGTLTLLALIMMIPWVKLLMELIS